MILGILLSIFLILAGVALIILNFLIDSEAKMEAGYPTLGDKFEGWIDRRLERKTLKYKAKLEKRAAS